MVDLRSEMASQNDKVCPLEQGQARGRLGLGLLLYLPLLVADFFLDTGFYMIWTLDHKSGPFRYRISL